MFLFYFKYFYMQYFKITKTQHFQVIRSRIYVAEKYEDCYFEHYSLNIHLQFWCNMDEDMDHFFLKLLFSLHFLFLHLYRGLAYIEKDKTKLIYQSIHPIFHQWYIKHILVTIDYNLHCLQMVLSKEENN